MPIRIAAALAVSAWIAAAAGPAQAQKITYIQGVTGNPFYTTVSCGGADMARQLGVKFDSQGPQQFQPALQMRVLDAVIASKPDGILFTADDPVALTPTLLQAKAMGIKILSVDGDIKDTSVAIANIQSNNIEGGRLAAQHMARLIGEKGKVMALRNTPAANVAQQRLDGFLGELAKYPGITFIGEQFSNNQTAKAASIVTATVAAHPDLAGIFTITTNNTEGAATGVREAQRVGKIKIVGFDTSEPIVQAIRNGVVSADVVQFPYGIGQIAVKTMADALAGREVERQIQTPFVIATPENIDTPEVQKYIYKSSCAQ